MNNRIKYTFDEIQRNVYYQMPKFLFEGELENLTNDARVLYSLLRDRHNLSIKNQWINEKGEVYLIFSRENMCAMLKLSKPTVIKAMNDLKKYNLIEEKRLGQGKANHIYLLQVDTALTYEIVPQTLENIEKERIFTSRSKDDFSEVKNIDFKNEKNFTSESQELLPQEVKNFYPINNDFKRDLQNNIEIESMSMSMSMSDSIAELSTATTERADRTKTIDNDTQQTKILEMKKEPSSIPPADQSNGLSESPSENTQYSLNDFNTIEKAIQENISYNYFRQDIELVNNFVACMVDTMLTDDSVKITISNGKNKETKPISVVKSILMRITHEHIQHAIDQYKGQHHKITYKVPYMRNMLYNTYLEMDAHYTNQVRADGVVW